MCFNSFFTHTQIYLTQIEKAVVSERLSTSPCALVASSYGWSGNMERIMRSQAYAKQNDPSQSFYQTQKKTLEINPRHPIIKDLKRRSEEDPEDQIALDMASVLFDTATVRSGFLLQDTAGFAERVDRMLRQALSIPESEEVV